MAKKAPPPPEESDELLEPTATRVVRSYRLREYKNLLRHLNASVQEHAAKLYEKFLLNPHDPALHRHPLTYSADDIKKGREEVYVGLRYRAVFRKGNLPKDDDHVYVWEWIGSKESFNTKY